MSNSPNNEKFERFDSERDAMTYMLTKEPYEFFVSNPKDCPVKNTISIIGDNYCLQLLRELVVNRKAMRFSELESETGINPKTLTTKLKYLVKQGILLREESETHRSAITYRLTEKGMDLDKMIKTMADWSLKWYLDDLERPSAAVLE